MHTTCLTERLRVHHDGEVAEGEGSRGQVILTQSFEGSSEMGSGLRVHEDSIALITTIDALCALARRPGADDTEVVLTGPDADLHLRCSPEVDAYLADPSCVPSPPVSRVRLTLGDARVFCLFVVEESIRNHLDTLSGQAGAPQGLSLRDSIMGFDGVLSACQSMRPMTQPEQQPALPRHTTPRRSLAP